MKIKTSVLVIVIIISGRFLNTIDHLQPTYIGQKTGLGSSCGLKAGILLSRPLLVQVVIMLKGVRAIAAKTNKFKLLNFSLNLTFLA